MITRTYGRAGTSQQWAHEDGHTAIIIEQQRVTEQQETTRAEMVIVNIERIDLIAQPSNNGDYAADLYVGGDSQPYQLDEQQRDRLCSMLVID